jgi:hypothetical protein
LFVAATVYNAVLISSLTSGLITCLIEWVVFSCIDTSSLFVCFSLILEMIVGFIYFHQLIRAEYAVASCIWVTVTHCQNELLKNHAIDVAEAFGTDPLFSSASSIHVFSQNPNLLM